MKRLRSEPGFTIVEVMVAITLLLVGVLGSVTLVDQANKTTTATKAREGATSLARELTDDARNLDYKKLVGDNSSPDPLRSAFEAVPALSGTNTATGWRVVRRGITYTVVAAGCLIDDPKDGVRSTSDTTAGLCSAQPSAPVDPNSGSVDSNPDDFRQVRVNVSWDLRGRAPNCTTRVACVTATAMIANPQLGPSIVSVSTSPTQPVEDASATDVTVTVNTTVADSVSYQIDDGNTSGSATAANGQGTQWTFSWPIKAATCGSSTGFTLDGTYTVTLQGTRSSLPGNLFAYTIKLNRCVPVGPAWNTPAGGRNTRLTSGNGLTANGIEELQWTANPERDVVGYRVYQVSGADGADTVVGPVPGKTPSNNDRPVDASGTTYPGCGGGTDGTSQLFCFDPAPPPVASPDLKYYVVALDRPDASDAANGYQARSMKCPAYAQSIGLAVDTTFTLAIDRSSGDASTYDRYGCPSIAIGTPALAENATRPTAPTASLQAQPSSDSEAISWAAVSGAQFYRIYVDSPDYSGRIGRTSGSETTFVDRNAGNYSSGGHTYYVTTVDANFQESDLSNAVAFSIP